MVCRRDPRADASLPSRPGIERDPDVVTYGVDFPLGPSSPQPVAVPVDPTVRYSAILPTDVLLRSIRESYAETSRDRDVSDVRRGAVSGSRPRGCVPMHVASGRGSHCECTDRIGLMRPQLDPLDPGRDAAAVARVLATDALCAECIARRTGVDVDAVLEAVGALEAQVRVHRTWGRCPVCAGTGRTVLRLDEGS